jgi:hypothetical protein
MMSRWKDESGRGGMGTIFFLLLMAAAGYFALKFVPVRINAYAFADSIEEEASFASQRSDEAIHSNLVRRAKDLSLPIKAEQIKVARSDSQITVEADYTVQVETAVFTYPWHFQKRVIREVF